MYQAEFDDEISFVYACAAAIQPMRYTDAEPPGGYAKPLDSLQIYSINVAEIRGGLHWPIHVYGMIAVRDVVDRNRNIIFDRSRDDCQTLTNKVLFLTCHSSSFTLLPDVDCSALHTYIFHASIVSSSLSTYKSPLQHTGTANCRKVLVGLFGYCGVCV